MKKKWGYGAEQSQQSSLRTKSAPFDTMPYQPIAAKDKSNAKASLAPSPVLDDLDDIIPASSPPAVTFEGSRTVANEPADISDKEWLDVEQQQLEPEVTLKGSEDFLVPDSPRSERSASRPSIDFGRFAFAG